MLGVCLIRGVDSGLAIIGLEYYRTASTYVFSVIPLFIAMGFLAQKSQLSQDAFNVIRNFIGHLRGGLAMATTVSAAIFSTICGDSIATAITIGSVSLPEMRKSKYTDTLSLGCIAAGGNLGFSDTSQPGVYFLCHTYRAICGHPVYLRDLTWNSTDNTLYYHDLDLVSHLPGQRNRFGQSGLGGTISFVKRYYFSGLYHCFNIRRHLCRFFYAHRGRCVDAVGVGALFLCLTKKKVPFYLDIIPAGRIF